jgi:exonuclease III
MVVRIQNTSIIMVGDWNVVQDYETETANYRSQNNIKAQRQIIDMKNSLDLIDIWRAINPDTKRYTWRGPDLKNKVDLITF